MPIYLVETTAQVRRFYRVEAADPKAAEEATTDMAFDDEEDVNEETHSVTELPDEKM